MELQIRRLRQADAPSYMVFRLSALREAPRAFSDAFEDEHTQPLSHFAAFMGATEDHATLGAFRGDELVGVATFKRDPRKKARHRVAVHTMYVAPHARGAGIAARLLSEIVRAAKALAGVEQVHLWVLDPEASAARRLYQRAGFVSQGLVRDDLVIDGAYVDAEYMVLTWAPH